MEGGPAMSVVKFPEAVTAVTLGNGRVLDGTDGSVTEWEAAEPSRTPQQPRIIDISWYEEQRGKLLAQAHQVQRVNQSLARAWYKIVKRSLADLPIQDGGRSILNPHYGANLNAIATALGLAPRTLGNYRTAVSRIRDDVHFEELIEGCTWASLVFRLGASPARRVQGVAPQPGETLPPVKRRFVVQVPVQTADFLMENGLEVRDVTAVIVSYLRQPKVRKDLLKLFRANSEAVKSARPGQPSRAERKAS
jgi:hypothetical protein